MQNKIPVVFGNKSNYDYHFITDKLTKEFKCQFDCLGENTEKYKNFSVLIEKELRNVDKAGNQYITTVSYNQNLLIVKDLWQIYYQILPFISQKEFTKLNAKIAMVFLNIKVSSNIKYKIFIF